jgi:hypothetical protein
MDVNEQIKIHTDSERDTARFTPHAAPTQENRCIPQ